MILQAAGFMKIFGARVASRWFGLCVKDRFASIARVAVAALAGIGLGLGINIFAINSL